MDIGECPKIHDNALRADFEKAQQKFDHYYDVDVSFKQYFKVHFKCIEEFIGFTMKCVFFLW